MKLLARCLLFLATAFSLFAADARVFELRTYTSPPGKRETLLERFAGHTLALFEKHGMTNIAYWLPVDAADGADDKIVYLLAHASRDAAKASWAAFNADPEWREVAKASEANGRIVSHVESTFLTATDYSPALTASVAHPPRMFELRTYTTPEGKLAELDARFGGGETDLFAKAGMTGIGYFHPLDADKGAGHTLVYILAHKDRDAAKASWKAFSQDPEWVKMKATTEANGRLTSKIQSVFLTPTEFSPLK